MKANNKNNYIIYYDFNNINYSIYFLTGLIENAQHFNYKFKILRKYPDILNDSVKENRWQSILFSICLFKARFNNNEFYFCIDTRDSNDTKYESGNGYYIPLLKLVKFYFKVNYNKEIINNDPDLSNNVNKIIPICPFTPLRSGNLFKYPSLFYPSKFNLSSFISAKNKISNINGIPTIDVIKRMRNAQKIYDVFFVMNYYDEKIHSSYNEYRYQIMREIKLRKGLNSIIGFASENEIVGKYSEFWLPKFKIKDYLMHLANSKVAIYVRGLHNCISFKFLQLLGLGMPIIGQPILNNTDEIMSNNYFNEQFAFNESKEIIDAMIDLLKKPAKLKSFSESNANLFDNKYTPQIAIRNIINKFF